MPRKNYTLTPDPIKARGIGLKQSEWARWDEIADQLGMTTHSLAAWALREFMRRWEAGEIPTETRQVLSTK